MYRVTDTGHCLWCARLLDASRVAVASRLVPSSLVRACVYRLLYVSCSFTLRYIYIASLLRVARLCDLKHLANFLPRVSIARVALQASSGVGVDGSGMHVCPVVSQL